MKETTDVNEQNETIKSQIVDSFSHIFPSQEYQNISARLVRVSLSRRNLQKSLSDSQAMRTIFVTIVYKATRPGRNSRGIFLISYFLLQDTPPSLRRGATVYCILHSLVELQFKRGLTNSFSNFYLLV